MKKSAYCIFNSMDAYAFLFQLLNKIVPLEPEETELIRKSFRPLHLKKGDYFLQSGEINKNVGFLAKGLVRYYVFKDDEESTFIFTKEGEFIADYQSFNNKTETLQNIHDQRLFKIPVDFYIIFLKNVLKYDKCLNFNNKSDYNKIFCVT